MSRMPRPGLTRTYLSSLNATVSLPDARTLPPRPQQRLADGTFVAADGRRMSQIEVDAIYAGHFIADNRQHFSKPGAFEELFRRVVDRAEDGQLEVKDRAGDSKGAQSMVRQVARVLGYGYTPDSFCCAVLVAGDCPLAPVQKARACLLPLFVAWTISAHDRAHCADTVFSVHFHTGMLVSQSVSSATTR